MARSRTAADSPLAGIRVLEVANWLAAPAAAAMIAALYHRERTGKGQYLQGSLLHTGLWVLGADVQVAIETGREPRRRSRSEPQHALWNTYRTKDGEWIMLAAPNMTFWPRICRALELGDLVDDPDLQAIEGQMANSARVTRAFEAAFASKTLRQLKPRLEAEDLIWSAVTPIRKAIVDRQAALNGMIVETPAEGGPFRTVSIPIRFSDSHVEPRGPAPEIGQHTEEVLVESGLTWEEIGALRDGGVLG